MFLLMVSVLGQAWTAVPEGRIEAEESFTRIRDVTTRERTVYVLEPFLRHLLMFDLTGRQLAVVGRKGQGPGEFSQPGRIGWKGDTLWVVDHPNRIHYFSPAGKFYRTDQVRAGIYGPVTGGVIVLERDQTPGGPQGDGIIQTATLRHYRPDHVARASAVLNFFVMPLAVKARIDGRPGMTMREEPLRDDPTFTMDRDGRYLWIVLRRTRNETPHTFTVVKLTTTGDTVFSRNYPYQPKRIDKAVIENRVALVEQAILTQSPAHRTEVLRADLAKELYRPFHMPPVEAIQAGQDGTLWLRRESLPGKPWRYLVLSAKGDPIGTVDLPAGEAVMESDGQRVWTLREDEDAIPSVVRYRLRR